MSTVQTPVETLARFKRDTSALLKQIKKSGAPLVLTVGGKERVIVQDAAAFRKLLADLERAEAVAGIQRGLADVKAGRTRTIQQMRAEKRRKYGIST